MSTDKPIFDRKHPHAFDESNPRAESRTRFVVLLTVAMMIIELIAGWAFHSMALLADGWHMSSHAIALGLSAAAYTLARRLRRDERFAFGTWKIEVLAGYTSAVVLLGVAAYMAYESAVRLFHPVPIAFNQAIGIAVLGLAVNLYSAWLLAGASGGPGHTQAHGHDHAHSPAGDHAHAHDDVHGHDDARHDLNLRSAYVHVAADAATSVLAIAALTGGKFFGVGWLDPVVGFAGSTLVAAWAVSLLRSTARALVDAEMDAPVVAEVREAIESAGIAAELHDLHVWRVGKNKYACMLSIGTDAAVCADDIRALLAVHEELVHITVELNPLTTGNAAGTTGAGRTVGPI